MDSPQRQPERKKTKGKSKADEEEELLAEETTPEPDQEEDYAEWLRWKKRQWKRMRTLRKLRRKEGAQPGTSIAKGTCSPFRLGVFSCTSTLAYPFVVSAPAGDGVNSVVSYARRQRAALLEGVWEIIEIRPLAHSVNHFRTWYISVLIIVPDQAHSNHHCAAFLCSVHHRVLVGDALHSLTLEVPRVYYINYRKAPSPHELVTALPLKWPFVALV